MNQALLHVGERGAPQPLPWKVDFTARGLVVVRAASQREAEFSVKAYDVVLILADVAAEPGPEEIAWLAGVAQANGKGPVPIIALCAAEPDAAVRAQLAEGGVKCVLSRHDPAEFLQWHIDLLLHLRDLALFEQTRYDVNQLAKHTREHLHDLSQPLSAVQGRLQLLAAKCPADDANAQVYADLVKLILEVSRHLMELQQTHRKYS